MHRHARLGPPLTLAVLLGGCGAEHEVDRPAVLPAGSRDDLVRGVQIERGEPFTEVPSEQPVGVTVTLDAGDLAYRISSSTPRFGNTGLSLSGPARPLYFATGRVWVSSKKI